MPATHTARTTTLSVNAIARQNHEHWLAATDPKTGKTIDRSYSPNAKTWGQLSPEARKQCSRGVSGTLNAAATAGVQLSYTDEYSNPSPGEAGFADPEHQA